MDDIQNTEGGIAGAIHVALSVCCAMHMRLAFVNTIVPVKTKVTNALGMPSGDCTDGVQHELNTAMWCKTLNERAVTDATCIIHFATNHTSSSANVLRLVREIVFVMMSSECFVPPFPNFVTNQQKHTEGIKEYIRDLFVAEANARVPNRKDDANITGEYDLTATPVDGETGTPVDVVTGIPIDVLTGTPVNGSQVHGSQVPTVASRPMVSQLSSTAIQCPKEYN